jgi:hypothetical protein
MIKNNTNEMKKTRNAFKFLVGKPNEDGRC